MKENLRQSIGEALRTASADLRPISLTPRLDAEVIMTSALHRDRAYLLAHPEQTLSQDEQNKFAWGIEQRAREVPIPYITKHCEFYGLRFNVNRSVLIPRPETERLIEAALAWAEGRPNLHIIDVGTGSGAIAVTLAKHLPDAHVTAIDIESKILRLAQTNAERHGVADRIAFENDIIYVGEPGDLIAANLPYIPTAQLNRMPGYEPRAALDGGEDGLRIIRAVLRDIPHLMKEPSLLLLEIGAFDQAEAVSTMVRDILPGAEVRIIHDYAGLPRIVRVEKI